MGTRGWQLMFDAHPFRQVFLRTPQNPFLTRCWATCSALGRMPAYLPRQVFHEATPVAATPTYIPTLSMYEQKCDSCRHPWLCYVVVLSKSTQLALVTNSRRNEDHVYIYFQICTATSVIRLESTQVFTSSRLDQHMQVSRAQPSAYPTSNYSQLASYLQLYGPADP